MKPGKKMDNRALVMLLFGLFAVFAIMLQMRNSLPKPPPEIARLNGARIGIVDSTYINLPFRFMIKKPNGLWQFEEMALDTTVSAFSDSEKIAEQILWCIGLVRTEDSDGTPPLASARIGILPRNEKTDANSFAINLLAEMIKTFQVNGGRARILQQVTSPAHQVLKGDYFAVVAPAESNVDWPVIVCAVLPRGDFFYILYLQTTELSYPAVRHEFERIVQRFYPLPSTIN